MNSGFTVINSDDGGDWNMTGLFFHLKWGMSSSQWTHIFSEGQGRYTTSKVKSENSRRMKTMNMAKFALEGCLMDV